MAAAALSAAAFGNASTFLNPNTSFAAGGPSRSLGTLSRQPSKNIGSHADFSSSGISRDVSKNIPPPNRSESGVRTLRSNDTSPSGSFRYNNAGSPDGSNPENNNNNNNNQSIVPAVQITELELENIRRIFKQFDADGSNTIDVEELALVMHSLGVEMDEAQLTLLVEQVTNEGEQELTFEEFVSLITLWKEAAQYKLFEGDGFKSLAKQHVEAALESDSFIPDSHWRAAWDVFVCVVAVLYWVFVLLLDAYTIDGFDRRGLVAGDVICTLFLVADVLICARTAFARDGRVVDNQSEVFDMYRRSWLVPDVLAALPLDLILTAAGATPVAATVLRHLRLLKMCKVPTLWRTSSVVPITSPYITFHFHLLPIFQLFITFVVMVHGFAIGWVLIKQDACNDPLIINDCEFPYTPAVYFVIYALSTVGLGDIKVTGEIEHWYACAVLIGAMASNGIVIGKLVQILQRADIKKEQRSKLRETLAVLEHYHIAPQLQTEILQFQAHVFENNLGAAYESIVSDLPSEMRTNISLFVRMKLVSVVPLFRESHFMLRIAVAQALTNAVARPEQYMTMAGQTIEGIFFLAYGFADEIDSGGRYSRTLRSGDFFGETALIGSGVIDQSVKALTYCDLWILHVHVFEKLLERFPKFHRTVLLLRSIDAETKQAAVAVSERQSRSASQSPTSQPSASQQHSARMSPSASVEDMMMQQMSESQRLSHQQQQQQQQHDLPLRPKRTSLSDKLLDGRRKSTTTTNSDTGGDESKSMTGHDENGAGGGGGGGGDANNKKSSSLDADGAGGSHHSSATSTVSTDDAPRVSVREIENFLEQVRLFKERLNRSSFEVYHTASGGLDDRF